MPFPQVGVPDDPRWAPEGLTMRSLRHPVSGLRGFLSEKWNSAQCDWLAFLCIRTPASLSDEQLTLITNAPLPSGYDAGRDSAIRACLLDLHSGIIAELARWRKGVVDPSTEDRNARMKPTHPLR